MNKDTKWIETYNEQQHKRNVKNHQICDEEIRLYGKKHKVRRVI